MIAALAEDFCDLRQIGENRISTNCGAVGQGACASGYGLNEGGVGDGANESGYPRSLRVVSTRDACLRPFHPAGCEVVEVAGDVLETVGRLAAESDWTVLIAPEQEGALLKLARLVEAVGGRLLSPNSAFVEIASSKQATAEAMARSGVPVPRGVVLAGGAGLPAGFEFPVVVKPIDGCGSQRVRLMGDEGELTRSLSGRAMRVEEYVAGLPVSVSLLCGANGCHALPACEQRLTRDGRFEYLGGRLPLAEQLDQRARRLAMRAIEALPTTMGYVGVDLVLGAAADGSGDRVIEVNPRLTTSYVGLRAASERNLAAAMLAVAAGEAADLRFRQASVIFTAAGDMVGG
jgi:predicted ATP-grasp superfamily ATP-dependent carboligase